MKIRKWNRFIIFLIGAVVLSVCAVLMAVRSGDSDKNKIRFQDKSYIEEGWTYLEDGQEIPVSSFPARISQREGRFFYTLPEQIADNGVLVFGNAYQKTEVLLDGERIYQYGMDNVSPYFLEARIKCQIDLLPEYAGKRLEIRLISDSVLKNVVLRLVYLTTGQELAGGILKEEIWVLIFCIVMGVLSIALLSIFFVQYRKKNDFNPAAFLYLGLFGISSGLWVFTDSGLSQLVFDNSQTAFLLSFEVFMLMPVPMILFIFTILRSESRMLLVMEVLYAGNFILQNLLYLFKVTDFIRLLVLTHAVIVLSVGVIIGYMIKEALYGNYFYAKWILAGASIFAVCTCLSLVTFYISSGEDNEQFFILGFLIFVLILSVLVIRRFREFSEAFARTAVYQELAYKDMMTGLGNRTLYEQRLEAYEKGNENVSKASVFLLDINNLKEVNDRHGHYIGDRLVKNAADCIREAYGKEGECYRIGGDEFVAIFWGRLLSPERYKKMLDRYIVQCNKNSDIKLSIASGYAGKSVEQGEKIHMKELVAEADTDMYKEKKRYHEKGWTASPYNGGDKA